MVRHPESDLSGALCELLCEPVNLLNQGRNTGLVALFAFHEIFLSIGFRLLRICPMDGPSFGVATPCEVSHRAAALSGEYFSAARQQECVRLRLGHKAS